MHQSLYSPFPHYRKSASLIVIVIAFFLTGVLVGTQLDLPSPAASTGKTVTTILSASAPILAVKGDTGEGVIGTVVAEVQPGRGRVLVNTNPFIEPDTQFSAETAAMVAARISGIDLSKADVIISFDVTSNLVGGPSAGAAMATAIVAALEGKRVRAGVAFTGTIESDGRIGMVGGIVEKAESAAEAGKELFVVPKGQGLLQYYEPVYKQKRVGPFTVTSVSYEARAFDLNNYTTTELGMRAVEAGTIEELLQQALE
ncbi:hypothetical protein HY546_00650 [archaeon]|nr:hypothetical protein [archaeon]